MSEDDQFVESSRVIVGALIKATEGMTDVERIILVYNEAIDDAINFTSDLASRNPQHRLPLMALEAKIRHWLPLRKEN